jgi:hypothetical protein
MAADYLPALGALPLFLFPLQKLLNAILPDVFQVLNQVHPEKSSVPFVELTEGFAGKVAAFITVLYLPTQKERTLLFEEGALFVPRSTADAVRHSDPLALYVIFASKESTAYGAVHPARGN